LVCFHFEKAPQYRDPCRSTQNAATDFFTKQPNIARG